MTFYFRPLDVRPLFVEPLTGIIRGFDYAAHR